MQETLVWFLDQEITWRRERLPTPVFLGFPCGSAAHSEETWVWSLGWEESPGEGKCYPLHYSGLENSMDCIVHRVIKSGFHFTSCIKIFSNFSLSFHFLKWWLTLKFLPLSDLPVLFFMFYLSKPQDHKNIKDSCMNIDKLLSPNWTNFHSHQYHVKMLFLNFLIIYIICFTSLQK